MANWQTPKTNYDPATVVGPGDLNRIEGNVEYLKGLEDGSIKAAKAKYADSAGQIKSGTVTLQSLESKTINHGFNSHGVIVSVPGVLHEGGIVHPLWRIVDANNIEIKAIHSRYPSYNPSYTYRYTIYKP